MLYSFMFVEAENSRQTSPAAYQKGHPISAMYMSSPKERFLQCDMLLVQLLMLPHFEIRFKS